MKKVTYTEYSTEKKAFFEKHNNDFQITTSPMDEYSRYVKKYLFADNAVWFEVTCTQKTFVTKVECEVAGIKMVKEVTDVLCETEYFNTDNGTSKFLYEK